MNMTKIMTKLLMIPKSCCQLQSSQPAKCHQEKHLSAANRLWHKSHFLKVPLFKSPPFLKVFLFKVPFSADCKTDNDKSPTFRGYPHAPPLFYWMWSLFVGSFNWWMEILQSKTLLSQEIACELCVGWWLHGCTDFKETDYSAGAANANLLIAMTFITLISSCM